MKFVVKVDGREYSVEVETVEEPPSGAQLRVESAPPTGTLRPPPKPAPRPPVNGKSMDAPAPPAALPPWNALGEGKGGEACSPVAGVIAEVHIKPGDMVRAGDRVVTLEVSHVWSSADKPMVGTVRAHGTGIVREVKVVKGDAVEAQQPIALIS